MTFSINHNNQEIEQIESKELKQFALHIGLEQLASCRYSMLFVFHTWFLQKYNGFDPTHIIDEIKALEQGQVHYTKPPSEFLHLPLKGLWHKHFFGADVGIIAKNIQNQLPETKMRNLIEEVFDPNKSSVITQEMISELAHRVVSESIEKRSNNKLTGEWIVFAKENQQNFYLCIASHDTGDTQIFDRIKACCLSEFQFLNKYIP